MANLLANIKNDMDALVSEWIDLDFLKQGDLFVIGCSTSEVVGQRIGSSGSEEIAAYIYNALDRLVKEKNIYLAFQCCEHLNRAVVVEKAVLTACRLEEVAVVPVPEAGGSMAAYAFKQMDEAVMVEGVQAHAGIDIGDTLIGMQLKPVAVPLRFTQTSIGNARVTGAKTRPKLIGGKRAQYQNYRRKT